VTARTVSPFQNFFLKAIALLIAVQAFGTLVDAFEDGVHVLRVFRNLVLAFVSFATAVGFARFRGWAFLLVSVWLLWSWFGSFVGMIVAFNAGYSGLGKRLLVNLVLTMVFIGYIGRWKVERLFRPHLETDAH